MAVNLDGEKVLPMKTCFSMFETYCSFQKKNCWQIEVLKNKMRTVCNEYSSREKLKKVDATRPRSIIRKSERQQNKRAFDQTNVEEKQNEKEMGLF